MRDDNVPLGIVLMLATVFLFSVMNTMIKELSADYPINQIVFFRSAFALIPVGIAVALNPVGLRDLRTARPWGHLWRGLFGGMAMVLSFLSFALLPLGEAVALNFAAPLFLTALSVPLLAEKVGVHRWSAVAVGFVGVLVMARPGADVLNLGALVALAAAFFQALAMIMVRQLGRSESPNATVTYFTLLTTILCGGTLPFWWRTPDNGHDLWLLIGCGLIGGVAQLLMTRAYMAAPASVIAPFNYTSILWAVLLGWLLWSEVPTTHVIAGAAVVVASGLYILYRETVRRVPITRPAIPGDD
ncbi:DMT family transporter [Azospirillum oleiclasticum]|nr:DMT family transporter [Azospirillum oleiclasticum]